MRLFYAVIICMMVAISSFAQTIWTGSINNDWNNNANWTANAPTTGVLAVVIASPNNPVISSSLTVDFQIQNFATITLNADVINNGTINNFGSSLIINNAEITNSAGHTITNNGQFLNNGVFINQGSILGSGVGVIKNAVGAVFNNNSGATIQNFAMIDNFGTLNNDGGILNFSVFENYGEVFNNGSLTQGVGGVFNNLSGAVLHNNGGINNSGAINNNAGGTINNNDFIQNNSKGAINNEGSLINISVIINAGFFENGGVLTNDDSFTNDFGAYLLNTGNIQNNSCATFKQFTANPIGPDFTNNGIVYQIAGAGNVSVTGGTGEVLNDINQLPVPMANCQDIFVVLDAAGNATIEPLDIDNSSSAGYCFLTDFQININTFTCANVGPNPVTLTVTDAFGFTDFCTANVIVVDGTSPVITNCPLNQIINLDAGECAAFVGFSDPTVTDICGATLIRTDNTGLNSGDAFPIGTTTIAYQATDGTSLANCSFSVTVKEYPNPDPALFCNGFVEVALDDNCQAYVGADDILEGGPYGCYDNYTVELFYDLDMTLPVLTSPYVTGQNIGDTLIVSITEPLIGNSCWGKISVKDYIAPQIICQNITITCLDDASPDAIGYPVSSDNCDNGIFPLYTDSISGGGCADGIISRSWTVSDASGNSSSCEQIITIVRPDFALLTFPPNLDNLEEPALNCADNPNTHADHTGWPTINGHLIQITCNFSATYVDQIVPVCEGSYEIIREWQVSDWCIPQTMAHTQIIKVMDSEGPALTCPDSIEISTAPNSCLASLILPQPIIEDACSNNTNIIITASAGQISNGTLINLPTGIHTVTYTVSDDCGNESTCSISISVIDDTLPVAICEIVHNVSLTVAEPTLVPALVFDDGSYDNCSGLTYQVRRMDASQCPGSDATAFGPYVPFYCCDVSDEVVMIELLITDASGNTNSCMIAVNVEDKLNPAILCPADITLTCNDDYTDLSLTGEATAFDNCSYTLTYVDSGDLDNCGGGLINRIWTATDPGGRSASCVQKIYIVNDAPFYISDTECNNADPNDGVIWPCDYNTPNCAADTDPSVAGEPQIFEDGCDLVAVTYEDIELPITGVACLKIIRVWTIHDWCQYDAATGEGIWHYNQIIKVMNTQAPEFSGACENVSFCSYEEDCGDTPVQLIANAIDDCSAVGDLNFNYEIDLNDDNTTDYTGSGNDASGSYPLGTHRIKWFVEDGCGNVNTCTYLFVISDCKNPTAYCMNGLAVELMQNINEIEIQASAFDLGSADNCGIDQLLIVSPSQGPGQNLPPVSAATSIIFDCTDVGTQSVDVWVSDIFGNWGYCSTYIIIQDNAVNCSSQANAQIAGTIANENGENMESVMVHIEGNAPGIPDALATGLSGGYGFPDLPMGYDYTIQPEKDEDPLNGVSTLDLVLMNRHILESQRLDSPYKIIAADINASGSVSTIDLVLLRRLILQINDDFTANTSWRFVDADFVFPNPADPFVFTFPEHCEIADLGQNQTRNFVAIKTGDVNGNAVTSNFTGEGDDRNREDPLIFTAKDELLNPGRKYQIDFTAPDINIMNGYQFTLNFDIELLAFNNIIPGTLPGLSLNNFGLNKLNEGVLTTSWNQAPGFEAPEKGSVLFSLVFEVKAQVSWSEAIAISSKYTRAEAYNLDSEVLDVQLAFEGLAQERQRFKIYPNQPNPFADETLISFSLPEDTPLTFTLQDVSGKIIQSIEMEASAGYNEIIITKNDLSGPGVYFYTIKTKTHRVTQRMVLIKE
jgi:hypothetical protein